MKSNDGINWKEVGAVVLASVILAILLNFTCGLSPSLKLTWKLNAEVNVSYQDLAATLLTAVAIVLAVLAAFVGLMGLRGYKDIKIGAAKAADAQVRESIADEKGRLHQLVKKEVQAITYKHLQGTEIPQEVLDSGSDYGD